WLNAENDSTNNWTPIGGYPEGFSGGEGGNESTSKYFSGIFNGNFHFIYNLYVDRGTKAHAGLFGAVRKTSAGTCKLENVILVKPKIKAGGMAAALAGFVGSGGVVYFENCQIMNGVLLTTSINNNGFIIGATWPNGNNGYDTHIKNCAATGHLKGKYIGGITGNGGRTIQTNCYFAGTGESLTTSYGAHFGGISGYGGTLTNCYSNIIAAGDAANTHSGTVKTLTEMQDPSFVTLLGDTIYKADCGLNNGLPILIEILCGVPVTGITDICSGQSTTLTATGWDSYAWNTGAETASITVSPTTTTSYYVTGTTGDNSMVDTVTVYVSQNIQVAATIALSPDGDAHGTITASAYSQSCASSSPITISITAETGYYIAKIVVNGVVAETFDVNEALTYSYVISSPQSTSSWDVVAHLDNKFTVTTTKVLNDEDETVITANGLVSPNNGNFIIRGLGDTTVYFHETARYHIEDVIVDGTPYGAVDSVELTDVLDNVEIKVVYSDDCGFTSLPYTDDFESYGTGSAAFPECHEKFTTYSNYPYVSSSATYASSGSKYVYFYGAAATDYNIFVLPMMKVEDVEITDLRVKFSARASSTSSTMEVGVMSNALDASSFVSCGKAAFTTANVHNLYKIYLDEYVGSGKFIAFKFNAGASAYAYLDDIAIELIPACIEVENLSVGYITGSSALVSWDASISEPGGYNLEWREAGGDWTEEYVEENYFPLQDLTAATKYEVRVNADCGGETSVWDTITFHTLCDQSDDLQVGTGTSTSYSYYFPVAYYNAYSQQLFEASELGNAAKEIKTIQLQYYSTSPITRNVDIYLGHTTRSSFSAAADFIPLSSMSKVFSGKIAFNNKGEDYWMTIVLDSAFEYNGTGNLVFAFDDNGGAGSSLTGGGSNRFYNHSASGKTVAFYQSSATGANIDPAATTPGGTSYLPAYRNNIRFGTCEEAVCIQPNAFRATGTDINAIDLAWIENTTADGYELEYKRNSVTTWTPEDFVQGNSYQLGGLSSNTLYDIRLRSNCSDDPDTSAWVTISVRTACDLVVESDLPFTENFDSYLANEYPSCWSRMTTGANLPYVHRTASDVHSSPSAMDFHYSPNCANVAVLPEFDMDIAELQMDFWVKSRTDVGRLLVGVMEDPDNYSTFVCVDTVKTDEHQTFQEYSVKFNTYEGDGKFIAFSWTDGTGTTYLLDDIYVDKIPVCDKPEQLVLSNVQSSTVDASWVDLSETNSYVIEVGPSGFAPGEEEEALSFTPTGSPFTLTGLEPNTTYDFYIKTDCGPAGQSAWTYKQTFATTQIPAGLPYTQGFEDPEENLNWTLENGTQVNKWCVDTAISKDGSYGLYISNNNGAANNYNTGSVSYVYAYRTLDFDEAGEYEFSLDWKGVGESSWDLLRVFLVPADVILKAGKDNGMSGSTNTVPSGWIDLGGKILNQSTNWTNLYSIKVLTAPAVYNLVFFWKNDGSGGTQPPAAVDNIVVKKLTCPKPENLTVTGVTTTEATASWQGNSGEWELEWGPAGFAQGTGNVVGNITDTFHTVTPLSANTLYDIRVRSICDDGDTSVWTYSSFRTACGVIQLADLPYNESFDEYGTGTSIIPTCWTRRSTYGTNYPYINTINASAPGALYFYASATTHSTAATEQIGVPVDELQVEFKFRTSNITYGMTVGVMTDPTNDTTFTPLQTVFNVSTTEWRTHTVYLNQYAGNGEYIAFRMSAPTSMYLDDVEINLAPSCIPVQNLAVSGQTISSADFTWAGPENAASYEIEVGLPGFTPGDGTADVTDEVYDEFYNIAATLDPATSYVFAVRSVCEGDDGESTWTLLNFSTAADETYGDEVWHGYVYKSPTPDVPANRFGTYLGMVFEQPVFDRNPGSSTTISWTGDSAVWVGTAPAEYFAVRYRMTYDFSCDYYAFTFTSIDDAIRFSVDGGQNWVSLCHTNGNCGPQYSWTTLAYPTGTFTGKAQMDGSADLILEYFNAAGGKRCSFSYAPAAIGISTASLMTNSIDVNFADGEEWDVIVSTSAQTDLNNPTNVVENPTGITSNPYTISNLTAGTTYYIYAKLPCGTVWGTTSATTLPSCPAVTNIHTTAVTASSADLAWTAGGTETEWSVKIVPAGADHSTYTATTVTTASHTATALSDGTPLNSNTSYDCWVQANCGTDDNSTWTKHTFKTACGAGNIADMGYSEGAGSIPWVDNFNYVAANLVSDLPACWTNVFSSVPTDKSGIYVHTTDKRLDFGGGPITSGFRAAVMPELPAEVDVTQLKMKFNYGRNASGTYVKVCMTDNPSSTDINDYELVGQTTTTAASPSLPENSISFEEYTGTARYIAFVVEDGGGIIDNLKIWIDTTVSVTCAAPTGLTVTDIESTTATAGWNASATAVTYTLEYKKSAAATYNAPVTGITTTSHPLTGLEAGTQYDVRVKSVCADGESNFTAAFTFTTETQPCLEPTNLAVSQIADVSAMATWTKGGTETSWKVEYKVKSSSGGYTSATANTTSYPLSDLVAETEYEVCVKADCGGSESVRVCTTFTTLPAGTITHTIEASAGPNGTINPAGSIPVPEGDNVTFTFHPDAGYKVETVTVNGLTVTPTPESAHTISNVQANGTI
ncbi:fibronectin type III domain-containing protein, partial [Bacteroidales bacterium OttesenSCG-928-C03]|nr:fibronectin type III domain-containing protein [Bacteroidales bacterium OttesenSCG-928-C03]